MMAGLSIPDIPQSLYAAAECVNLTSRIRVGEIDSQSMAASSPPSHPTLTRIALHKAA
jgi:hypothetical protein